MSGFATGCTCGSGAHPRRCAKHPSAYGEHVAELNGYNEGTEHGRADERAAIVAWLRRWPRAGCPHAADCIEAGAHLHSEPMPSNERGKR